MDLCVSQNLGCNDQRFWGYLIVATLVVFALVQLVWAYWSGYHDRQNRSQATPMAIRSIPLQGSSDYPGQHQLKRFRHSQAYPVKKIDRWPMRGLDRLLSLFFRGGSISGF